MFRRFRHVLVLLIALILTGCISSSYVQPSLEPDPNDATVYMLRDYAEPWGKRLTVSLDQKVVASVANLSYVVFRYPAGEHALHAEWPRILGKWDDDGLRVDQTVTLEPGKTHYFLIMGDNGNENDPDVDEEDRVPASLEITELSQSEGITLYENLRHWKLWSL